MSFPLLPYQPHPSHIELMVIDDITFIPRHIVCAAIRFEKLIVTGVRHHDVFMNRQIDFYKAAGLISHDARGMQGFVDQYGQFLNRVDAATIAVANHQQLRDARLEIGGKLYSENLY